MALGLLVEADMGESPPGDVRDRVAAWFLDVAPETTVTPVGDDAEPGLLVALHPSAEEVRFTFGVRKVEASASTTSAGPGYHADVVDRLSALGEALEVRWNPDGDETGYFATRDFSALQDEMLAWLSGVARIVLAENMGPGVVIALPMSWRFDAGEAFALTPLGPRSKEWLQAVVREPQNGKDFFPWWARERDAAHHLGTALGLMWTNVRWRTPSTKSEEAHVRATLESLAAAWSLDTELEYPFVEWMELLDAVGEEPPSTVVRTRAKGSPRIGYRRRPVALQVSGWQITLGGNFSEEWEDGTLCAVDGDRTAWFTTYTVKGDPAPTARQLLDRKERPEPKYRRDEGEMAGVASLTRSEEDPSLWLLSGEVAKNGALAVATLCFRDPSDEAWAVDVWRSIR